MFLALLTWAVAHDVSVTEPSLASAWGCTARVVSGGPEPQKTNLQTLPAWTGLTPRKRRQIRNCFRTAPPYPRTGASCVNGVTSQAAGCQLRSSCSDPLVYMMLVRLYASLHARTDRLFENHVARAEQRERTPLSSAPRVAQPNKCFE